VTAQHTVALPATRRWSGPAWQLSLLVLLGLVAAGWLGARLPAQVPLSAAAGASGLQAVSAYWPAAGVALAALVRGGSAQWPAVALGLLLAHGLHGLSWWLAALVALGSTAATATAAHWLRHEAFNPQLERRRDLWLLMALGVVGAPTLSAANGTLWLAVGGLVGLTQLPAVALHWWLAEALGSLVCGVALLTLSRHRLAQALQPARRSRTLVLLACSGLAVALAFLWPKPSLGAAAPALVLTPLVLLSWLAMRSGLTMAAEAVLWLSVGTVLATAAGIGPFATQPAQDGLSLLCAWLAAMSALALLIHTQVGELARREARWQLALEGSDLGVADWDLRTGAHYSSPRWRALLADPLGEQTSSLERWLSQVHAEDRQALRSALAPMTAPGGAGLRREVRVRIHDAWCWFDTRVMVTERDPEGQPLRVVASLADVGGRRNAEDRQVLSSLVFQHLHEGLVITDHTLQILEANPAYCQIMGQPRERLIGTVPQMLDPAQSAADARQAQMALWQALRTQGHWVGELTCLHSDGQPRTLHLTVSSVRAPDGATRHHVLVVTDLTEQRAASARLARQVHLDELTQLPNRARFSELMVEAMAATDRDGYLLAVCCLDLDHFKHINDLHGQEVGNRLLAEVAARLRSALRSRSQGWTDCAARLGGDEFALLLRAGTVEEARTAVERVLRVVSQPMVLQPGGLPEVITASVGATVYPLDTSDADTLLRHADHAMYGVKQSGRNSFLFFDPENNRRQEQRMSALGRIQEALDRDELVLYYQPKVDLQRGVVLGVEALLRWNHPERGLVPPAQFLPLIENTGLSASVGDFVLGRALEQLVVWQRQGLDLSVSVNISARHLQEPDFAQRLAELLARHPQPLGPKLELEVLETAALTDIGYTSALMARCTALGVRWALDDFGTGYSTLTYLKRLPVKVLKIDRSFVHNMLADAQDRAIVEGVISLARTFGCEVVAEGVETPAQARMLLDMGAPFGQGMGIAPPMPAAEVAPWVREWRGLFAISAASGAE